MKSSSSHKLLSVAGLSARKLSTKEKCKRQNDAERLEKLRLLVSYLKSGSSQPMVSPVALEADEIELAERYKLHMILRDDLLRADGGLPATNGEHQQHQANQQHSPSSSTGNTSGLADGASSSIGHGDGQIKSCSLVGISENGALDGSGHKETVCGGRCGMMSQSIGGATTSSPASTSSCNSMNHAYSTNDARSIPHIGTVTWVLRHSISDPGNNNFDHSPAFSSSTSSHHHNHHHHHRLHHNHHLNEHPTPKHEMSSFSSGGVGGGAVDSDSQRPIGVDGGNEARSECAQCESCAPSTSSYSGISLNNYCSAPTITQKEAPVSSSNSGQPAATNTSSNQHKSTKLFYIDDLDHIPSGATGMGAATAPFHTSGSLLLAPPSTPAVISTNANTSCSSTNLNGNNNSSQQQQQLQSPRPTGLASASSTATCCSQPNTPAISTTTSETLRNSRSACASAWSNAPNLATWIDNEVNSLVHDLEAESQQLSSKSNGSKKSKKKWLSVTSSSNNRRNSSGAQST